MNSLDIDEVLTMARFDGERYSYRGRAAQELGRSEDPRALPALIEMLGDHEVVYEVYVEVMVGLVRHGDAGVEAALHIGARSTSETHRLWFEVGVTEWWIERADVDGLLRRFVTRPALADFVVDLRRRLWLEPVGTTEVVPTWAGDAVAAAGDPDLDALITRSRSSSFHVRQSTLADLEALAPHQPRAFHRLVQMMMERDLSIMAPAAEALGKMVPEGLSAVLKAVARCGDDLFSERLWMPIQGFWPGDLRAELERQLQHPDPDVRAGAAEVIPLVRHMFRPLALPGSRPALER